MPSDDVLPAEYALRQYHDGDANVRVFYKYQAFRHYTIPTLRSQQIYLAKYEELNDPFDPFLSALAANHTDDPLGRDEYSDTLLRKFSDMGIFCVSEEPNSQLLWAHYGDSYRGFCLGYAAYLVPNPRVLHPVRYLDCIPEELRAAESLTPQDLLEGYLLSKPSVWHYEREWRFLMGGNVGLEPTLFPVVELIFGPRTPLDQRIALVEATRATEPKVRVAQPMVRDGRFEVVIEDVEVVA